MVLLISNIAQLGLLKMKPFFVPSIIPALHFIFSPGSLLELLAETSRGHLIQLSVTAKPTQCNGCISPVIVAFKQAENLTCSAVWCSCPHSSESAPPGGADCCHAAQYLSWSLLSLIWHQCGTRVTLSDCQRSG